MVTSDTLFLASAGSHAGHSDRTEQQPHGLGTVQPFAEEDVADVVTNSLEHQRVRRCMDGLTELQVKGDQTAIFKKSFLPVRPRAKRRGPRDNSESDGPSGPRRA